MKTITQLTSAFLFALFFVGCATVLPGNDPVVVRAEQIRGIALDTFDTVMKLERDNREALFAVSPDIKHTVDYFRKNELQWINGLDNCIQTYKKNRTPENKATLVTWLAVVEKALAEAQTCLIKATKAL